MSSTYEPFTLKLAWNLAAPPTWPAAIMPALIAIALSATAQGGIDVLLACVLVVICILMQSAANMINDYLDFKKGTDSLDDNLEADDAVLLHHHIDSKKVLYTGVSLLVVAFLLGIYPIVCAGFVPLLIAFVGAAVVVLYSCGKTPISYLPIGELVIGVVMGGLMPLACCYVLTRTMLPVFVVGVIPCVISVGLILLTNNTCDIEKDRVAHRKTLSVVIGRPSARTLYHGLLALWFAIVLLVVAVWYEGALFLLPFMVLAALPTVMALLKDPLEPASRIGAMSKICTLNVIVGAFYIAAIFAGRTTLFGLL